MGPDREREGISGDADEVLKTINSDYIVGIYFICYEQDIQKIIIQRKKICYQQLYTKIKIISKSIFN